MTISPPMATQRGFWNDWNARHREQTVDLVTIRQADVVESWLRGLGRQDLNLIEVGCGAGWFCPKLTPFGEVTATDLSDEVLARAKIQTPDVDFVAGDFMALDFGEACSTSRSPWRCSPMSPTSAFSSRRSRII